MKPELFLPTVVRPGLLALAAATTPAVVSREAEVLLTAIAAQESALRHRQQLGGPARGFWQFEKMGGLNGVLEHHRTGPMAVAFVESVGLKAELPLLWDQLPYSELLQAGLARLLLWSDNPPLPRIGEKDAAWATYLRIWRPGKPHRGRWDAAYDGAVELARLDPLPDTLRGDAATVLDRIEALCRDLRSTLA